MKRILIVLGLTGAALVTAAVLIMLQVRSQTPEVLLAKLAKGKGDREELIMRLNMSRGDVIPPMISAFQNQNYQPKFRAEVLELLAKKNLRTNKQEIEQVILRAAKDSNVLIRRKAVYCISVYGPGYLRPTILDNVEDSDAQIRRNVYEILCVQGWNSLGTETWSTLPPEKKEKIVQACRRQMNSEESEEMRLLAKSVVGRAIVDCGKKAKQAFLQSDIPKAEKILKTALELDPKSCQAQILLARFYFKLGEEEKALALCRKYEALIEVPLLAQAPVIDGDPTEAVWEQGYSSENFYLNTSTWVARPSEGKSKAYIGHRNGWLYVAVIGYEQDLTKLAREHSLRDSDVWKDDCVELILDPDSTENEHIQFVINPIGTLFDAVNGDSRKNKKCQYAARIFEDRDYWACEFAIKGTELHKNGIKPGTVWSFNVFRTRIGAASEQTSLWPLYGRAHNMPLYPLAVFK